jgi:trehalose 6-phosphate synthase
VAGQRARGRPAHGPGRQIVVASNRGPVSFVKGTGEDLVARRGAGGLATALTGALQRSGGLWVASAMSDEDRLQAARGPLRMEPEEPSPGASGVEGEPPVRRLPYDVRLLAFDPDIYDRFYNGVSNEILWFLHHQLWNVPRTPVFLAATRSAWDAYRQVNDGFALALEEEGSTLGGDPAYLVQDYHLSLVPALLRKRQPTARIVHFSHIPFAGPSYLRVLPPSLREELLGGLLGADVVGFQAEAWAESFLAGCRMLPDATVDLRRRRVRWEGREVLVGVYPISIDVEELLAGARSEEAAEARRAILRSKGDRKLLLRVDRAELSKNILRGFLAYEGFLRAHPGWRRRIVFVALLNPSREEVQAYRDYIRDCLETADRINRDLGEPDWSPIEVLVEDDRPRALAAYGLYDALMVNPVFDGMNLVSKEGPTLNRQNGVLILSENAGAYAELGRYAVVVNPFDVEATGEAIAAALEMAPEERNRRARALKAAVRRNRLDDWVAHQLADLERITRARSTGGPVTGRPGT